MTTENTQLVILDIQGKLSQIVYQSEEVLRNSTILIEGCKHLNLPIVWVEQMPDKLGATHPTIAELLSSKTPVKKSSFSAWNNTDFQQQLYDNQRKRVLLIGIETHICIYQTAVDLLANGYEVSVIADAVSSRTESNKQIGLTMLRDAGATLLSTEAALFAGDLLTMYQKYAEAQGWRFEIMEASMNGVGGFKEVVAMVSGQSVYSKLKYESGAHRVQRVPVTESQGRVHTSTATVLVMPEVEEVEYDIDPKDLRVDIYHASGAGGQNVNKVATAVRIVHLPTNIKVEMQEERTQQKNREKAMKIIRARVADHFAQIAQDEQDAERKSTIGTGDRSERIRTYNFPQNRVTDHRIGLTLQKLDTILSGKLDEVVDALVLYDQTQKLEELNK